MSWIFFAISAHLLWAFNNIFDRYIMEKRMKNPVVYTVLGLIVASLVILVASPWIGWTVLSPFVLCLMFVSGIAYFFGTYFYLKSIQTEEASRVSILLNIIPLFNFILAWGFLDEVLSTKQFIALAILLTGGILGSIHIKQEGIWHFSKVFWLMILSALCYSMVDVSLRYAGQIYPSGSLLLYVNLGLLLAPLFLFFKPNFSSEFRKDIKRLNWKLWIGLLLTGIAARGGLLLSIKALSQAPTALATAFSGFQVLFVFAMALLITKFAPLLMKEETDKKNLILKFTSLLLMIGGLVVLSL